MFGEMMSYLVRAIRTLLAGDRKKSSRGTKRRGALGERYAAKYLRARGMKVLKANWRCRAGEIDLVMLDGSELVFAEVKTRVAGRMAEDYLLASLTTAKKRKLRMLVDIFLAQYFKGKPRPEVRIDVLGVVLGKNDTLRLVRHLTGVV
jgi:putative endonuclease